MPLEPLSKRNAEIAEIALREINKKLFQALATIQQQQHTLSDLITRTNQLEQFMNAYRANLTGRGPTVK